MGAQDSLAQAQQFREDTGATSFPMIWDENFASWQYYGISSQPAVYLVDAAGQPLGSWRGSIPVDEVLELVADA